MKKVTLIRQSSGTQGTFGRILIAGGPSFFTGELPWKDNQSNVSCIPAGIYTCRFTYSPRFKRRLYLVERVKDRSVIRIHPANFMGDHELGLKCQLNGCIALGLKLGMMDGQKAVLLSQPAIRQFNDFMKQEPFDLEVRNA